MIKKSTYKNIRNIMIAGYLVFVMAMATWCWLTYHKSEQSQASLEGQKARLSLLNTEIEHSRSSVDNLKADQEEFKKLLFNDRDVPAFLDGLSRSAASTAVRIIDMKTQRFSQIIIPKDISGASLAEQHRVDADYVNANTKDPRQEFNNLLTLAAMPIHIQIQGSFRAIVNFLNAVENERQLLTVSNVEINRGLAYPQLDCQFILKIYSLEQLKDIKP